MCVCSAESHRPSSESMKNARSLHKQPFNDVSKCPLFSRNKRQLHLGRHHGDSADSVCVNVCECVWMCVTAHSTSQPFLFFFPKRPAVVWIIYGVWPWPLSAADNVEEKKCLLCINYLHNGHKKIIIIKNKEVLMAAGRMKVARGSFLHATCS